MLAKLIVVLCALVGAFVVSAYLHLGGYAFFVLPLVVVALSTVLHTKS